MKLQPLTSGKFDKALKKEDLRNTIHEAEKLLGVTIAFDGSELAVTHQDLSVVLEKDRNVINNREDSELVIRVKHVLHLLHIACLSADNFVF